jgi:DNA processing protein
MSYTIIPREDFSSHPLLARLLELHSVPGQLYTEGKLPDVTIDEYGRATPRILSIVGSRRHTTYGRQAIEKLVASLQGENVIIVSGLAHGIDSIAHSAALKNNLKTFAILGSGLDPKVMYPSNHLNLREDIVTHNGLVVTELPPDTKAAKWTFPARNRIVAALSDAVLVVEAEEKSGTLITARLALELGRDIGAIPGEIFSPTSSGTNLLIRDGAYLTGNNDDLFALLHLTPQESTTREENYSEAEQVLLSLLIEPTEKDTLLLASNLPLPAFLIAFSSLEVSGAIEETFGEVRKVV